MIQCEVYKERGYTGCLRAAFDLVCNNFAHFVRKTWLAALLVAVASALTLLLEDSAWVLLPAVVSIVATSLFYACCMHEVVDLPRRKLTLRFLKVIALCIIVVLLFELLALGAAFLVPQPEATAEGMSAAPNLVPYLLIFAATTIVMIIAFIPAAYSTMKYVVEPHTKLLGVFGKYYLTGWRSWGYLFVTALLTMLFVVLVSCIVYIPIIILRSAEAIDNSGVALGDVSALPASFPWLYFVAALLASFINAYISLWVLMIFYFAYGKISSMHNS